LRQTAGIHCIDGPVCRWYTRGPSSSYIRETSRWLTNSDLLARLVQEAGKKKGACWQRHVEFAGNRLQEEKCYPPVLVKAILKGLKQKFQEDGELTAMSSLNLGPVPEEEVTVDEAEGVYIDDVTGAVLEPQLVKQARAEEIGWVKKQQIYSKAPVSECRTETKAPPVG